VDALALLPLIQFVGDQEIQQQATVALHLLVCDVGLNSTQGQFGPTKGRTPGVRQRLDLSQTAMTAPIWVLLGVGDGSDVALDFDGAGTLWPCIRNIKFPKCCWILLKVGISLSINSEMEF